MPLTTDENIIIIQKVYEKKEVLLGKLTNKLTNRKKKEEWQKIADYLTRQLFFFRNVICWFFIVKKGIITHTQI